MCENTKLSSYLIFSLYSVFKKKKSIIIIPVSIYVPLTEQVKVGQLMETKVMTTEQKKKDNYVTVPLKEITKATRKFSDADCKLGSGFLGTVFKVNFAMLYVRFY